MDKNKVIKIIVSIIFIPLIIFFSLGLIGLIGQDVSSLITCIIIDAVLILSYKAILIKLNGNNIDDYKKLNKWIIYLLWALLAICTGGISLIFQLIIKRNNKKNKIEEELLSEGYNKIYTNLYINESDNCILINNVKYGFSQIVDCELIENNKSISTTYGNTEGKIMNNGKIKAKTNTLSSEINYCNELYLNITIDDFNNPNIKFNVKDKGRLNTNGNKYRQVIKKANEILSLFKLIISKNNEKYIEKGTITKIEHRYIEEKGYEQKLKELSELYKNGTITDYEYSIKKQELLEKIE